MTKPKPARLIESDDLPIFTGQAPTAGSSRPFAPTPTPDQPSMFDLRPAIGMREPTYTPAVKPEAPAYMATREEYYTGCKRYCTHKGQVHAFEFYRIPNEEVPGNRFLSRPEGYVWACHRTGYPDQRDYALEINNLMRRVSESYSGRMYRTEFEAQEATQ